MSVVCIPVAWGRGEACPGHPWAAARRRRASGGGSSCRRGTRGCRRRRRRRNRRCPGSPCWTSSTPCTPPAGVPVPPHPAARRRARPAASEDEGCIRVLILDDGSMEDEEKKKKKRSWWWCVCGESKERVYRIDVREQAGGMEQVKRLSCGAKASRHPIVAFRIYSHGVRIRMLVEMNPGCRCGDAYRACWSWTRRKNRLSPTWCRWCRCKTARESSDCRSTAPPTAGLLAIMQIDKCTLGFAVVPSNNCEPLISMPFTKYYFIRGNNKIRYLIIFNFGRK